MRLKNKVVIITGAASGIGAATAALFAREGARVVATDMQVDALKAVVSDIHHHAGEAIALLHDVASEAQWINVVEQAAAAYGTVDVLVNNAGISDKAGMASSAELADSAEWDRIMNVNLKGPFLGIKHVLPVMKKNGRGSIINISSVAAMIGTGGPFIYTASKGGLRSMTKHVAVRFGTSGIRANSIHPGGVKTPMIAADFNADAAEKALAMVPLGRLSEPLEVAQLALFLASDESSYITGAELTVDGGLSVF